MPPTHFADWFRRHAFARPTVPAIVTPRVRLSYLEFYRALLATARRLRESGIERGQSVVVCGRSHALLCVLLAALNRLGVASLTRGAPTHPDETMILPDGLHIDRFVIEQPFLGTIPNGAISVDLSWLEPAEGNVADLDAPGFRDGNETSAIFTTSGTTGAVKAVGLSVRQLEMRFLRYAIGRLGEGRSETTLSVFGLGTAAGFRIAFETFWAGGTVFLGWQRPSIAEVISRNGIVRIYASPAEYQAILQVSDLTAFDTSILRYALVAGSAMPRPLVAAVRTKLCDTLINIYGSTELGGVSFGRLTERDAAGRCGVLFPWVQAQAVDLDGTVLPPGSEGALRFRCGDMITGYLNDPGATAEHFKDGWFYPGDTGHISEDRVLTIAGRVAERINAGGIKVNPEIIEQAVLPFEGIAECAAFGAPDAMGLQQIWLAIVADRDVDVEKLRDHCARKLGVSAPRQFLTLPALPRNETGKVLRNHLAELAGARSNPQS